jgi:hypothetical protein
LKQGAYRFMEKEPYGDNVMTKVPGSGGEPDEVEILSYRGYQLRASQSGADWIVWVGRSGERPTLMAASDREGVIDKAQRWIDDQLPAANDDVAGKISE